MAIYTKQTDFVYKCKHTDYIRDINAATYVFVLYKPNGDVIRKSDLQVDGDYLLRVPTDVNELAGAGRYGYQIEFTFAGKEIPSDTEYFDVVHRGK
jgi:uncharacterized protein YfaS (alpha-2-macroglobulin family)